MRNNKQSSVEWYSNQIGKITADALSGKITGLEWSYLELKTLIEAKAMHREEVLSFNTLLDKHEMEALNNNTILLTKEEFYNETFGGNNE